MLFSELGLHPDLIRAVKAMNFEAPTPIQEKAIPPALEGRDVLGCAQTGSGKTASFALPVLHHLSQENRPGIRALVLVPTRELAAQVDSCFREMGKFTSFKTAIVIGGVGFSPQVSAARHAQIVIATPGRLLDHLRQGSFRLDAIERLVLDEADRMLDMGFLPDIRAVIGQLPKDRQTLLFSATLAPEVQRIAAFALRDPLRVEVARPTTVAEGISQILYPVVQSQKPGLLIELLKATEMKSVLIFTRTKHGADKLAKKLASVGHPAGVLHGNRSQNQRTQAMEAFRHGRVKLMVATDIAARGIDVKGISHVVNFDVPRAPEDYVHRVGRTARAYGVGDAVTFMDPSLEGPLVKDIERFTGVTFPRAELPGFQYNNPPREESRDERPRPQHQQHGRRDGGHGRGDQHRRRERPGGGHPDRIAPWKRRDGGRNGGQRDQNQGQSRNGNGQQRDGQRGGFNRPDRPGDVRRDGRPPQSPNGREPRRDDRRPEAPKKDEGARIDAPRYRPSNNPGRLKGWF